MNIYVKAFLDRNWGDDLMIIKLIRRFPQDTFYIYCDDAMRDFYSELLKEFGNYVLTPVELWKVGSFGPGFFRHILLIGGSVLQGSRNRGCYYRLRNITALKWASLFGTRYAIVGCNTGPFINGFTRFFVELELKTASFITTRDKTSYDHASRVNRKAEIHCYSDILMNFAEEYNLKATEDGQSKILGVSVFNSKMTDLSNDRINRYFARLIDQYIEETGGEVFLLAFNVGIQNDRAVADRIYELISHQSSVRIVAHGTGYLELPEMMARCHRILALRFHSAILGVSLRIPTLPIMYSNKADNLLSDLGYQGKRLHIRDIETVAPSELISRILSDTELLSVSPETMRQADGHMKALSGYWDRTDSGNRSSVG